MRRFSQRHSLSTLAELNITPLLDLAFVLLIIFMITTPLLENSMELIAPTSVAAKGAVDAAHVQTISIDRFEAMKLNDENVDLDRLVADLTEAKRANPELAVIIRPHRDLAIQKVINI